MRKIHLQCHVGSALKEFHRCSRKKNVGRNNAMDDESVRQPSWLPRYTTETRKPAAPVSKVNAAHRECCHRPAPPELSSSPPIVRLPHPLPPFFECAGGKKSGQSLRLEKLQPAPPTVSCSVPGQDTDFTSFLPSLHFKKKENPQRFCSADIQDKTMWLLVTDAPPDGGRVGRMTGLPPSLPAPRHQFVP